MDTFVLWAIIIIAFVVIGRQLYRRFYDHIQPQHSLKVVITGKQMREFMGRTRQENTEMPPPRVNYYVSFRPQSGGREREFQVSEHLYERLEPDSTGTLVIQGRRFIAFEPDDVILDND
ncbi:DUF2500 domain-containing protein [Oceanimonas doudoroffii]|uniref:DUF2500 domain-containing protein n=1 Tax=Oceanimonas doudoroffii TaxID=84158 RepID=A0A233RDC1_9GAMM|nr:DUF2500 domain-containing protein [Oceanimonas doudoroffii]OXY81394.1 hypothetical protein B6S08_12975 [Oceanimonas doudoroffii]